MAFYGSIFIINKKEEKDLILYLFLFSALLSGAVKGYCGKRTSKYTEKLTDAASINALRMLLCSLISIFLLMFKEADLKLYVPINVLFICALSGISLAAFVICWLLSVRNGAYMTLDISLTLGTVIPIFLSWVLWNEQVTAMQWLGFSLLLISA